VHSSRSERELIPAPGTVRRLVVDTYHGVDVEDPYRWLESSSDPEVVSWIASQNKHTRAILDAWPGRDALKRRVAELTVSGSVAYGTLQCAGGKIFAIKRQPPLEQVRLVVLDGVDNTAGERVIVDPNALDPTGKTSIDWFVPSFDGSKVAVSLSFAGTESGDVHVFDASTGTDSGVVVPRVNGGTAGGSLAWAADGAGFFYTRYPRPGERSPEELGFDVHVYWHAIGSDPDTDRYEVGREFPRIAEILLETGRDGRFTLASVQRGDGGEFMHWLRDAGGAWHALTSYADRCVAARVGSDGAIYFVSLLGAPRGRVLRIAPADVSRGIEAAAPLIPEAADAIATSFAYDTGLWIGDDRLYVHYQRGGPNVVRTYDLNGHLEGELPQPPLSAIDDVVVLGNGDVLFQVQSLTLPPAWHLKPRGGGPVVRTALVETSPADFSDCEVVREEAGSPDGTRVPITVLRRQGIALDGSHPTILYGYGGYGVSQSPAFRARLRDVDRKGRGLRRRPHPRRRRARRGVAPRRKSRAEAKRFRRLRRVCGPDGRSRLREAREAGAHGRKQRRPADGRDDHAAPRAGPRRRLARRLVRHAARRAHAERRVQRAGVRERPRFLNVRRALHLLALPSREGRHRVPVDPDDDRRERPARGLVAQPEDDRELGRPPPLCSRSSSARTSPRATAVARRSEQIDEFTDVLGVLLRELT
jgi:hypothetical protein